MAIDSLKLVARQSGVEIVFDSRVVTEVRTPAIRGSSTPLQAFQLLLKGTSLAVFQDVETAAFAVYRKSGTEPNSNDRMKSSVLKPKAEDQTESEEGNRSFLDGFENRIYTYEQTGTRWLAGIRFNY